MAMYRSPSDKPLTLKGAELLLAVRIGGGSATRWTTETNYQGTTFRRGTGLRSDVRLAKLPLIDGDLVINQPGPAPEVAKDPRGRINWPPAATLGEEQQLTWTMSTRFNMGQWSLLGGDDLRVGDLIKQWDAVAVSVQDEWRTTHPHGGGCDAGAPMCFDMVIKFRHCDGGHVRKLIPMAHFHGNSLTINGEQAVATLNGTSLWPYAYDL